MALHPNDGATAMNPIERLCNLIPDRYDHAVGIVVSALLGVFVGVVIFF
jgi:hypothetical protein